MGRSEKLSQAPAEERLRAAFESQVEPLAMHLYDQDMEAAGMNTMLRLFGIEMGTLSQNTQIVLYPTTIYKQGSL